MQLLSSTSSTITLAFLLLAASGPALAEGSPEAGKVVFNQCLACHTIDACGPNHSVGPNLHGIFGKPAASNRSDFDYSSDLRATGLVWDDATLDAWIRNPAAVLPNTRMEFLGLPKKDQREDLLAYMKTVLR